MGRGSFSTTGLGIGAQLGGGSLASFGDFETVPPAYELDGRRYNFVSGGSRITAVVLGLTPALGQVVPAWWGVSYCSPGERNSFPVP